MTASGKQKSVYFIGIGGTGMTPCAGLLKEAGWHVEGSDQDIYPPMSDLLRDLDIPVKTPYSESNIVSSEKSNPDFYVVANALSRGHVELEKVLASGKTIKSFPQVLGEYFLRERQSIVVTGTHGKTTTTSLIAHALDYLGWDPSFLIGGQPINFDRSFRLKSSPYFVIEGDEYDTAFFDKKSKFLHYSPTFLLINNIEFDHADIFKNVEEIYAAFRELISLVKEPKNIIANMDDAGVQHLVKSLGLESKVTQVWGDGKEVEDGFVFFSKKWGKLKLETPLFGEHNLANFSQCLGFLERFCEVLEDQGKKTPSSQQVQKALNCFRGVKRRAQILYDGPVRIYDDFAHHPTAVMRAIQAFKKKMAQSPQPGRLHVAFDPRNASSRRNIFQKAFGEALQQADVVYLNPPPEDKRIPESERMNIESLAEAMGEKARAFSSPDELLNTLLSSVNESYVKGKESSSENQKDYFVFMSPGGFSGVPKKIADHLQSQSNKGL